MSEQWHRESSANRRKMRLKLYRLRTVERGKPEIGRDDCAPWVIEWVRRECGREIAFPHYESSDEGWLLAESSGGLAEMAKPLVAAAGLTQTYEPRLGDIGVIRLGARELPVVFASFGLVLIRAEGGGVPAHRPREGEVLIAWRVPSKREANYGTMAWAS